MLMKIRFSIIGRKHKCIHISNKKCEWIIRFWSLFKWDVVKIYNPSAQVTGYSVRFSRRAMEFFKDKKNAERLINKI